MRILMVNDHISFGGGGDAVFRLERDFYDRAGFETFTFSHATQMPADAIANDIVHLEDSRWSVRRAGKFLEQPFVSRVLGRAITTVRPNLIRLHLVSKYPTAVYRALHGPVPVVQTLHGPNLFCATHWGCVKGSGDECEMGVHLKCARRGCVSWPALPLHWSLHARSLALARRVVRLFLCPSRHLYDSSRAFGLPAEYLPLGIDPSFCHGAVADHNGTPIVLYAGVLEEAKGVAVLIEAFSLVQARMPEARLVIAGRGSLETELRRLATRLGIERSVDFRGFVRRDALPALYREAHVVVMSSIWKEQFGLVGPEALALGVPCVASDTGGIPEWLHHNKWGFLVPPRDPTALSDGVLTLLRDRDLRLRFGKQGRAFVLENYHPDAYRDRLLRIVERYAA